MQKITLPVSLLALAISVFSFFYFSSSSELVYVDVPVLYEGYGRTNIIQNEFESKAKTLNANVDSLMQDWQNELKKYEKERVGMTEKEISLSQEILQNKQAQLNNYQNAVQKQIKQEEKQSSQTIINDINAYVKEYGEEHGYKIIFGANGNGNIMYADDATNLTEEILKGLNEEFQDN